MIYLFPLALVILLSIFAGRNLKVSGERAFSSLFAGSFFGLFSWFFSMYFLGGWLFLIGGALIDSLIKIAGVNLRKERNYSLFFGLGFGLAIGFFSLFYGTSDALYGIVFSASAILFHSSTAITAFSSEIFKPLPRIFLLSIIYNLLLMLNSWASLVIALLYSAFLFHRQYRELSEKYKSD